MATYTQNISTALANDSVTNAKLANMAQGTIKGRAAAAGTGDPQDLTPDQASTILDGATDPFVRTSDLPAGGVSSVGATYPIQSSGGATPTISAAKSTGGNGSADGGKLVEFQAAGSIYFSNNAGSSPSISAFSGGTGDGIYSSADAGDGVMAVSNTGKAVHAIAAGAEPAVHANGQGTGPAIEVEQNGGVGADIATFHDGTGRGLTVLTDGGLAWNSATGSRTTTDALQLFDDTEKGVVPASGGGTTNFLRADGTWAAPGGGGGGISDGDVLATGLTFPDGGLKVVEEGGGANTVAIRVDEVLSADRTLNLQLNDGDRRVLITGDAELSGTNTGDETTTTLGSKINAATQKTTPVDADMVGLMDSAASNVLKKLSWANIKATLFTTVGSALRQLATPAAARWIRVNSDGTATLRSDTETRTDIGLGSAAVAGVKRSVEIDSGDIQLVGDSASPGNNVFYGTNSAGTRSFYRPPLIFSINSAGSTLTNHANALELLTPNSPGIFITKLDLTGFTQVMLQIHVFAASASGNSPRIILGYATSYTTTAGSFSDIGTSAVTCSMSSTGVIRSAWTDLAAGAIGDVWIAPLSNGGNGAADPQIQGITAYFR